MIEAISLAAGLSWASGLRLYLTVLLAGVLARLGILHLPATLQVLSSPWVIGAAALLAVIEFFADKIPAFDSLWDALHTLIRIPAGAVLAAAALGHADPALLTVAALLGGSLAGAAHLTKAGTRAIINLSPEPVSNWVASFSEDVVAVGGLTLALFFPVVFLAVLVAFLILIVWVLPRLWRGVRGGWRGMAARMVRTRVATTRIEPAGGKHD